VESECAADGGAKAHKSNLHPKAVKWHVHGTLDEVQILNSKNIKFGLI
jgi:hypothetical protein